MRFETFYALLPLFYAFFGLGVGYWLGSLLTGAAEGEMSFIKLVFGFVGGVLFAGGAYLFEPFRGILIGIGLGSLFGGLIASALGLTGLLGVVIMVVRSSVQALRSPYSTPSSLWAPPSAAQDFSWTAR